MSSIVVTGAPQAAATAGYIAAVTGASVHLLGSDAAPFTRVEVAGTLHDVDVVRTDQLPSGPLDAVVVVEESRHLRRLLEPIAGRLSGVPLLLAPGGFAGALRVQEWYAVQGLEPPQVAEATGFPVAGSVQDGCLRTRILKRGLPMAGVDERATSWLHEVFVRLLPELTPSDLLTTSLSNTNHMIHPGVVLLNAARIDRGEPFTFYRDGMSAAVGELLEAVDEERVALAARVGAEALGVRDWLLRFYRAEGMAGAGITDCLHGFAQFEKVPGPLTLDYRYLVDDVPFGLAQWVQLAADVDLPVPRMQALLTAVQMCAPHLDLTADPQATQLFRQFLATTQGVPA